MKRSDHLANEAAANFFRELLIPEKAIPALVAKCQPHSTADDWQQIANAWLEQEPADYSPIEPVGPVEPPSLDSPTALLEFCQEQRRYIVELADTSLDYVGARRAAHDAVAAMRCMGAIMVPGLPPEASDEKQVPAVVEACLQVLDQIIQWCYEQGNRWDEQHHTLEPESDGQTDTRTDTGKKTQKFRGE